jgi:hypothetical protein
MVTVPARPYIVIPAALCHRCGLGAGDHVLLAAVPGQNIYVIRTRRIPFFRSRPSLPMMLVPTAAAAIGIVLPFTGLSHVLGFTPLPATFFLVLVVLIVAYMALVDVAKALFYRAHGARPAVPSAQPPISGAQPATDPGRCGGSTAGRPRLQLTRSPGRADGSCDQMVPTGKTCPRAPLLAATTGQAQSITKRSSVVGLT